MFVFLPLVSFWLIKRWTAAVIVEQKRESKYLFGLFLNCNFGKQFI